MWNVQVWFWLSVSIHPPWLKGRCRCYSCFCLSVFQAATRSQRCSAMRRQLCCVLVVQRSCVSPLEAKHVSQRVSFSIQHLLYCITSIFSHISIGWMFMSKLVQTCIANVWMFRCTVKWLDVLYRGLPISFQCQSDLGLQKGWAKLLAPPFRRLRTKISSVITL